MVMNNEIEPAVGNWYHDLAGGETFHVVALDEDEDMVELQFFNGDIEEISINEWRGMDLEVTDAPEDWTGPIDSIDRGDLDFSETRSEGEWRGRAETSMRSAYRGDSAGVPLASDLHPDDEAAESEEVSRFRHAGGYDRGAEDRDG